MGHYDVASPPPPPPYIVLILCNVCAILVFLGMNLCSTKQIRQQEVVFIDCSRVFFLEAHFTNKVLILLMKVIT